MGLHHAYGDGEIYKYGEAEDRIIPNDDLQKRDELIKNKEDYPLISKYLSKFKQQSLSFGIKSRVENKPFEKVIIRNDKILAAVVEWKNNPQYFLSKYFEKHLLDNNLSVVRFREGNCRTQLNTAKTSDIRIEPIKMDFRPRTLFQNYKDRENEIWTHFILKKIAWFPGAYPGNIIGFISDYWKPIDWLKNKFSEGKIPLGIQTFSKAYYDGNTIIAGVRIHKEKGYEIFLTGEGYEKLKEGNLSIAQFRKARKEYINDRLEAVFLPEMEIKRGKEYSTNLEVKI